MATPILASSESPSLGTLLEAAINPFGMTIADLVIDSSITDADGAVEAIAIEGVDTSLGTWQYSLDGGSTWLTIHAELLDSSTNTLGLLLGPTFAPVVGTGKLIGGLGNDRLDGGAGLHVLRLNSQLGPTNVDMIVNFVTTDDTIQLDRAIFTALKIKGVLAADAFVAGTLSAADFVVV